MSLLQNCKCLYDAEAKRRGCDPAAGLEIGAWAKIIREGIEHYGGSDQEIAEAFLQADANQDGVLTFEEFKKCMTKPHLDEKKMKEVEELFKSWDKSGDSVLTLDEVKNVAGSYRPETIQRILEEADADHDGKVTVEEFKAKLFGQ